MVIYQDRAAIWIKGGWQLSGLGTDDFRIQKQRSFLHR